MGGTWSQSYDIDEEELEELRMLSSLECEEICRLRHVFLKLTSSNDDDAPVAAATQEVAKVRRSVEVAWAGEAGPSVGKVRE